MQHQQQIMLMGLGVPAPLPRGEEAKELGLSYPARPSDLSDRGKLVWNVLQDIDIVSARLERGYTRIVRALSLFGGAICQDLQTYNQAALRLYSVQTQAYRALVEAGVKGVPTPPFPPHFVGFGSYRGAGGAAALDIACASGSVVPASTSDDSSGVRLVLCQQPAPIRPEGGLGNPALIAFGLRALIVVGASWALSKLIGSMADKWANVGDAAKAVQAAKLEAEWVDRRAQCVERLAFDCSSKLPAGGDPSACLKTASDACGAASLDSLDVLRAAVTGRKGLFWWIGGITVVAGVTAAVIYWRRRKS